MRSCPPNQVHLRSHSGVVPSLGRCPTKPEFRIAPDLFRTLILERLRLPMLVCEARCECRSTVTGRHRTRALAPERTLAVWREAGASIPIQREVGGHEHCCSSDDARAVEVLAFGPPLFHGAPLTASGLPRPGAGGQG